MQDHIYFHIKIPVSDVWRFRLGFPQLFKPRMMRSFRMSTWVRFLPGHSVGLLRSRPASLRSGGSQRCEAFGWPARFGARGDDDILALDIPMENAQPAQVDDRARHLQGVVRHQEPQTWQRDPSICCHNTRRWNETNATQPLVSSSVALSLLL